MTAIGVDLGGTNLRVAVVDDGEILARRGRPTLPARGPSATLATVGDLIAEVDPGGEASAIGVAVTGPVDVDSGVVRNADTLEGWPPTDLITPLADRFGLPVVVENDANAAAVGEWWAGAGAESRRLAVVTVGTGIGVGLMVDGVIQRGVHNQHGEIGHHILDPAGPPCYCGARGCWEVLASGRALSRLAGGVDGATVAAAARAGDAVALGQIDEIGRWLGLGLVNLTAFFMPDVVLFSGSVTANFDLMEGAIRTQMDAHRRLVPTPTVTWAVAGRPDDAGVLGAAYLGLRAAGS